MYKPEGIISSMVTPFDEEGKVSENMLRKLITRQIKAGSKGIGITANTGEFINLTFEDIKEIIDITIDEVKGRTGVIVGALSPSMRFNIKIANYAKYAKANAILITTPYYLSPSKEGLFEYFREVGEVGIPMVVYNHPYKTPYDLNEDMIDRLLEIKTFVAIKDVDSSIESIVKKIRLIDNRISYLEGRDELAFYSFLMGGHGGFLSLSNLIPGMLIKMYNYSKSGDITKAKEIHLKVSELCKSIYVDDYPVALKEGLEMLGYNAGKVRAPLQGLKGSSRENLKNSLKKLGLL